jgi:hypothetical protein
LLPKSGIIVACVVGAASVIAGVLYMQPQIFAAPREPYSIVTFEGLKDTYAAGEPIEFYVRIEGYGCNTGFPTVWIEKELSGNQTQLVWERLEELRSLPPGYSCPLEDLHQVQHIGDVQAYNNIEQEHLRIQGPMPIVLDEGEYAVYAKGGTARDSTVTGEFAILPAP